MSNTLIAYLFTLWVINARSTKAMCRRAGKLEWKLGLPLNCCKAENRNNNNIQQGRDGLAERRWKAYNTKHRRPPRERLPLSATPRFNSTLQGGRCLGYFHPPHNSRGWHIAVPALALVFSFWDLQLYTTESRNSNVLHHCQWERRLVSRHGYRAQSGNSRRITMVTEDTKETAYLF